MRRQKPLYIVEKNKEQERELKHAKPDLRLVNLSSLWFRHLLHIFIARTFHMAMNVKREFN